MRTDAIEAHLVGSDHAYARPRACRRRLRPPPPTPPRLPGHDPRHDLAAVHQHRLPGYQAMTPDTIWRRFISTSGKITIEPHQITCRLNSRTYSPIMRSAKLPPTEIPWWGGRHLRFQFT